MLRDDAILFDVELEIPTGQRFPAHKAILAISSEYFRTLFAGRFKQSNIVILQHVEPQTVDLWLDMIYGKNIVISDWKELLKLLTFSKFTQSEISDLTGIMSVSSRVFVEYVQQLSTLYDGAIPRDIVRGLSIFTSDITIKGEIFDIKEINFSELGEEFVTALIETRGKEDIKYLIARKAINEGMSKELYNLVNLYAVTHEIRIVETIWHLLKDDKEAVTRIGIIDPNTSDKTYNRTQLVEITRRLGFYVPGLSERNIMYMIDEFANGRNPLDLLSVKS